VGEAGISCSGSKGVGEAGRGDETGRAGGREAVGEADAGTGSGVAASGGKLQAKRASQAARSRIQRGEVGLVDSGSILNDYIRSW
jgi:hypothetical protein